MLPFITLRHVCHIMQYMYAYSYTTLFTVCFEIGSIVVHTACIHTACHHFMERHRILNVTRRSPDVCGSRFITISVLLIQICFGKDFDNYNFARWVLNGYSDWVIIFQSGM